MDESSHLYRNNGNGTFTNVTLQAGLLNFGLSLSATISDLNKDGFKDIYVSNDFTSSDFYYINNGNGTFTDRMLEIAGQTSFYGMGADIADYNNDGLPDIIQIDMAPDDNQRAKENMTSMRQDDFEEMVKEGLNHQYRYSTLQLNRGIRENGLPYFSNTAWIAGVTSTDWSWGSLFADFDLDGWKDLYITNGILKDINNIDFFNKMQESVYFSNESQKIDYLKQVGTMPYKPLTNYIFKNNGNLTFSKTNEEWGITEASYSNGVAYADLDNDGDLELIVSNINEEALVYQNTAREKNTGNYMKIEFEGPAGNKMGIGAAVSIWKKGQLQTSELTLTRGYESSVEPILYFGWTGDDKLDSILITWPDGKMQPFKNTRGNQKLVVKYADAGSVAPHKNQKEPLFKETGNLLVPDFIHKENAYNDYQQQPLLPHKLSITGPCIATGDINNDGTQDFFIGNGANCASCMYTQNQNGNFEIVHGPWEHDSVYQDAGCLLFDADGDKDLDLYVVSGGNEFPENSPYYQDRLYINSGKGAFIKVENALPVITSSGSCVKALDFDRDGDADLFVGGRNVPGKYPFPAQSYILENKSGKGTIRFEDVTSKIAPGLEQAGMVTDAYCADMDNDNWTDLVVVGEWMPVCYFKNIHGKFVKSTFTRSSGWWFSINGGDFDKDGDVDLVAGNLGLNARYRADSVKTFDVFAGDFDRNGTSDIALSYYQGKKLFPLRGRECFVMQNPFIEVKFPTYASFGKATVYDLYSKSLLKKSLHLIADNFASCYFENTGNGKFIMHLLPCEAQLSPIQSLLIHDFNQDGNPDILLAGNLLDVEVVTPRFDGGVGLFLKGNGKGDFEPVPFSRTGFFTPGEVRSLTLLPLVNGKEKIILVGNNHDKLQLFKIQ